MLCVLCLFVVLLCVVLYCAVLRCFVLCICVVVVLCCVLLCCNVCVVLSCVVFCVVVFCCGVFVLLLWLCRVVVVVVVDVVVVVVVVVCVVLCSVGRWAGRGGLGEHACGSGLASAGDLLAQLVHLICSMGTTCHPGNVVCQSACSASAACPRKKRSDTCYQLCLEPISPVVAAPRWQPTCSLKLFCLQQFCCLKETCSHLSLNSRHNATIASSVALTCA